MKEKLVEMERARSYLSEEIFSTEDEKKRVIRLEEELAHYFRGNDRLLQELKHEWRTGELNDVIYDVEIAVRKHQGQTLQEIEAEIYALDKKKRLFEQKEEDLSREMRLQLLTTNDG